MPLIKIASDIELINNIVEFCNENAKYFHRRVVITFIYWDPT
jgi:hypothetical protein